MPAVQAKKEDKKKQRIDTISIILFVLWLILLKPSASQLTFGSYCTKEVPNSPVKKVFWVLESSSTYSTCSPCFRQDRSLLQTCPSVTQLIRHASTSIENYPHSRHWTLFFRKEGVSNGFIKSETHVLKTASTFTCSPCSANEKSPPTTLSKARLEYSKLSTHIPIALV